MDKVISALKKEPPKQKGVFKWFIEICRSTVPQKERRQNIQASKPHMNIQQAMKSALKKNQLPKSRIQGAGFKNRKRKQRFSCFLQVRLFLSAYLQAPSLSMPLFLTHAQSATL